MLDQNKLRQVLEDAEQDFKDAAFQFSNECTKVITENRQWEGFDGVRDIVDTGYLRKSQRLKFENKNGEITAELSWNTDYAAAVHNGATIQYPNGGVRRVPARPWTEIAAQNFDIEEYMG